MSSSLGRLCCRSALRPHIGLKAPLSPLYRLKSTLTTVRADPSANREVPTPIVLLSVAAFGDEAANVKWKSSVAHLSRQGYESLLLDLDLPSSSQSKGSLLDRYEAEMSSTIRSAAPFPPVLLCKGVSALVGQQYASSHPLTALMLVDPPISVAAARSSYPEVGLEEETPEFDFEARFPCRVAWTQNEIGQHEQELPLHRIEEELMEEGEQEGRLVWRDDEEANKEIQQWLEEDCGVHGNFSPSETTSHERDHDSSETTAEEETAEDDEEMRPTVEEGEWRQQHDPRFYDASSPTGRPAWFTSGKYQLNPSRSKKLPLFLDESHLRETFNRGGGKGGQAINKNRSRCDLLHLPTGVIVRCQETRSLDQNRVIARRRMSLILDEGIRGPHSVRGRAIEMERQRKRNKEKKQQKRKKQREAEQAQEVMQGPAGES